MKRIYLGKKSLVVGIIFLFVGTCIIPSMSDYTVSKEMKKDNNRDSPPEEEWNKTFGGQNGDGGFSVKQTGDGGFIIGGYKDHWYGENMTAHGDGWLIKTDKDGDIEWDSIIKGEGRSLFYSIDLTSDGGYILTGLTHQYYMIDTYDLWLVKTNNNGEMQWNKTFGSSLADSGYCVQQTLDGGYIVTGCVDYDPEEKEMNGKLWLIKTNNNGIELWSKKFNGIWDARGYSVQQTSDNGYIITGFKDSDVWLIKTDSNGNEQWNKTFDAGSGNSVQQTTDGGYIITGDKYLSGKSYEVWLIKTNSDGDMQWNKIFGGIYSDIGRFVQQTRDDGYIIVGWTESFGNGLYDVWLIKTDTNGNMQWNKTFGGVDYDLGFCVQQTYEGDYIISGLTFSYSAGEQDVWLIKVKGENQPPEIPIINGRTSVKPRIAYEWNFTSADPNNDNVFYQINWGDGNTSDWLGPYPSGEPDPESHIYKTKGTYIIKCKAKDTSGLESDWGTLPITVPYSYNLPFKQFWLNLFERFPNAFPILRHLMGC